MSKTAKQNKGLCGHWMSALDNHGEYCCVCCGCSKINPCFVSALWGETTWNHVLAKPYAVRQAKKGAKAARGGSKPNAKGKNTKTATSQANSRDVAVSGSSREPTTDTVSTVSVRSPSVVVDEKALLVDPCYNIQHGGPLGLATSHAPERLLALVSESADRDLIIDSQQSLPTTTEVVELGPPVAVPDTQPAHFDGAGNRLSGNAFTSPRLDSIPGMSSGADLDDTHMSVGRSDARSLRRSVARTLGRLVARSVHLTVCEIWV